MKKKIILSSLLTIALCFSLLASSTYALFTSEDTVNIAVTSGKVEMEASVENLETWSLENDKTVAGRTDGTFSQGGTAEFKEGTLTLTNVIPGDKVSFDVTGTNNSTVDVQYRVKVEAPKIYALLKGLEVTVNGKTYTSLLSYTSAWATLEAGNDMDALTITVELPEEAGNEYQDLEASLKVTVEAVQGNAGYTDAEEFVPFEYDFEAGESEVELTYVSSVEEFTALFTNDASRATLSTANTITSSVYAVLESDLTLDVDTTLMVASGRKIALNLNGHAIAGTSEKTGANYNMFDVRGILAASNGTITYQHTGDNMGWNNSTNVFNITAGGKVVLEEANVKNLGGSDMAFVAHLNNYGEVTLEVNNSDLFSAYIPVRVFNSGPNMNNVTITNSTLSGKLALWVHLYTAADFGDKYDAEAIDARLNINVLNENKTGLNEEANNTIIGKIGYGFTDTEYYYTTDQSVTITDNAEDLQEATKNGDYVNITEDVEVEASQSSGYGKTSLVQKGGVIDANGNTISANGANGTWDCAINTKGGTIKNAVIADGFRGIFVSGGVTEDIIIDNVIIDNVCYTFNSDAGNPDYSVIITNSTLNGWTSYSDVHKIVIFDNCNFGKGTGGYQYAFMRPYCQTSITNCTFEEGYEMDPRASVVLENCYYGDTLITAENVAELLSIDEARMANVTVK